MSPSRQHCGDCRVQLGAGPRPGGAERAWRGSRPALWGLQGAAGSRATARRDRAGLEGWLAAGVWEEGASSQPGAGHPGARRWGAVKDGKWNTPPEPTKAVCALKKKKKVTYTIADKRQTSKSRVLGENTRVNKGRLPPSPAEDTPEQGRRPRPPAPPEGPRSLGALP